MNLKRFLALGIYAGLGAGLVQAQTTTVSAASTVWPGVTVTCTQSIIGTDPYQTYTWNNYVLTDANGLTHAFSGYAK